MQYYYIIALVHYYITGIYKEILSRRILADR